MGILADEFALAILDHTSERAEPTPGDAAECVRRARAGDAAAFAVLVERHERMVFRTALRLLGRVDAAQDAMQEAFLRLHRYLHRFDESRELGPWLHRVVVRVAYDIGRRSRAERHVSLDVIGENVGGSGIDEVEGGVARGETRALVRQALATLPLKERAAIVLRDIEGHSTADVARLLGSSEGTVRSQISTARLKVKRFIEQRRESRA